MGNKMQTILGAGGAIGVELAKELPKYTDIIRLVSRKPEKVNPTDQAYKADLLIPEDVMMAVTGSEVVYLVAGLEYNIHVWRKQWPAIMRNVIEACKVHRAKLVFFDNIYLYDAGELNLMTEEISINPPSEKGKVRALIVEMIMDAVDDGEIEALIARAADFYGPAMTKQTSFLVEGVFKPLRDDKKANWLANDTCKHSFTYTPDAAKATALLGNTPDAYGQTWHLPTASDPYTGKQWVEQIAKELGVKPRHRVASKFIIRIMGLFMPVMKESVEMLYQYDRDYVFNSDKFEKRFNIKPTPYEEGIREVANSLQ